MYKIEINQIRAKPISAKMIGFYSGGVYGGTPEPPEPPQSNVISADGYYLKSADGYLLNVKEEQLLWQHIN